MNELLRQSVLVRVRGRDPTERKTTGRAFFTTEFGFTTFSASGEAKGVGTITCLNFDFGV